MTGPPDEPVGGFPRPPRSVVDDEGREILFRLLSPDETDGLVELYLGFAPADRAQGIPPASEAGIRSWLDRITGTGRLNLVARCDDVPVGHATLVPDEQQSVELAIFVCQSHQDAGVGTALLRTTLGAAQSAGVDRIWLTVERWNSPAIAVYRRVGFKTVSSEQFELRMALRLETDQA